MILRRSGFAALASASLIAAVTSPLRAGVIVVAAAGAGDYTSLTAAVNAAAEGDTILVRVSAVDFDFPVVDGKSLTIVGDVPPGSTVKYFVDQLTVQNLAAGQQVVVRNLRVDPGPVYIFAGIELYDNAGGVWIESCDLFGADGAGGGWEPGLTADWPGRPGLSAENCAAVTVVGCQLTGGVGDNAHNGYPLHDFSQATDGGPGLVTSNSKVMLYESTVTAGQGGAGHLFTEIADGGTGIENSSSVVFLSGCTVTGGAEGLGPPAGAPGDGARGDTGAFFELLESTVTAATGGADFDTAPGAVSGYPGLARSFRLSSPLREGQAGTLSMQGAQGDFVGFFWSFDGAASPMPVRNGWFLLSPSFIAGPFLLGAITDPGGTWILNVTGPNLPPASEAMTFLLQAYFAYTGGVTLSSGTAFTLVDSAF